ncbi:MAG: hypothetical protein KAT75_06180 [Dehalococcoidia bacterium]|nr:hypothetical protein [Dehalococcoidia bacterium]
MGSFNYERVDWEIALNLIDQEKVKVEPLVTHKLPLFAWLEGFTLSEEKKGAKVLLCPED